ncbi:hypothetical protein [Streptomyces sp. PR69]|uniref:hypothetical protein n=1 Tax=Streptomyces sp. PR69 TaxID=2984950 RepID=UPI002263E821|nr:hypothetical protein [Streptomyces sp. PR69]
MHRNHPPDTPGILAPHIPADTYRSSTATSQPIVIVQPVPVPRTSRRNHLYYLAIGLAGAAGVMGLIAAALALFEFAARTAALIAASAGPLGIGGITLRLARPTSRRKSA